MALHLYCHKVQVLVHVLALGLKMPPIVTDRLICDITGFGQKVYKDIVENYKGVCQSWFNVALAWERVQKTWLLC